MTQPDISVVVCSQQRAAALRDALRSLYHLETDGQFTYEVVVVDNASTDATPEVIEAAAAEAPIPIRGCYEGRKGISVARNRGVREASGRWIAFFDDDQAAHSRWLVELWKLAHAKRVRHVSGAVLLRLPRGCERQLDPMVGMLLGQTPQADRPRPMDNKFNPGAGNWLIERTVFDEVGMFDESIGARSEDTNLYRRAIKCGVVGWFTPDAPIDHIIPEARLEPAYLLKLSRGIGRDVACYEAADLSRLRFFLRWVAKFGRTTVAHVPAWCIAAMLGRSERRLGLRCRLALGWAHFCEGWRQLRRSVPAVATEPAGMKTLRSINA